MAENKRFCCCSLCGKKLIEKRRNGTFFFLFGDTIEDAGNVVELEALGLVRMRCLRRSCRKNNPYHWNEFNLFEINQPPVTSPKVG